MSNSILTETITPTESESPTTMDDLPEEIIAQILEWTPKNEIPKSRLISQQCNSSIKAYFGTTLSYTDIRSRLPQSLWQGHITILKIKDYTSSNPRNPPPLPRLRALEIEGGMRLQSLVGILGESLNLRDISMKFPNILDLDFDTTMAFQELPSRLESFQIMIGNQNKEQEIRIESSLFRILSQLPLRSLKVFTSIYVKDKEVAKEEEVDEELQIRRESPNDLSFLVKIILTKCRKSLRDLTISRSFDWPEEPKSPPIEREFKLKKLGLLWVGQSRWLRSLIESQKTRNGLESLIISCFEDLWVRGLIQVVSIASKATLKTLMVQLFDGQSINDEFSLGFLSQFSKLEVFLIRSGRDFMQDQGRRVLEDPLPPLILPPTLKSVILSAPITFQTLQSLATLPALEDLTLKDFKWLDWPTLEAIITAQDNGIAAEQDNGIAADAYIPSILLDWNWLKDLIISCPTLKSIEFIGCVFDLTGIMGYLADVGGVKFEGGIGINVLPPIQNVIIIGFTASLKIDRSELRI